MCSSERFHSTTWFSKLLQHPPCGTTALSMNTTWRVAAVGYGIRRPCGAGALARRFWSCFWFAITLPMTKASDSALGNSKAAGGGARPTQILLAGMNVLRCPCRFGCELHRPRPGFRGSSRSCRSNGRSPDFILRHGQQLLHDLSFFPFLGFLRLGHVSPRQDDTDRQDGHNRDP